MEPNSHCHTCGAPLYRRPSHSHFKRVFCDVNCLTDEKVRWIGFIATNYQSKRVKELAEYIGIPRATLRTWIFYINQWLEGYTRVVFPKGPVKKERAPKVKKVKKPKPKVIPKMKEVKVKPAKAKKVAPKKVVRLPKAIKSKPITVKYIAPKREVVKIPTRTVDPATLKSVRVDAKTVIQVSRSIPDEVAIENYWKKRKTA